MIKAETTAHSLSPQRDELISILATFPRIILAEVNTHRMLSKNTSSSRAIPFKKMIQTIKENPFIPIAFQKEHSGMQGTEYFSKEILFSVEDFMNELRDILGSNHNHWQAPMNEYLTNLSDLRMSLKDWWLFARDRAIESACIMHILGVTKQLCNRLLEPFMWTTMLITGPREGWENFFALRCPAYDLGDGVIHRSKKDALKYILDNKLDKFEGLFITELDWLLANKGQAEIHMMALAECIWDSINESTPKELLAGEWHLPFKDKIDQLGIKPQINSVSSSEFYNSVPLYAKISTAMAARTSYTIVGEEKEIDYLKMVELHDKLIAQNPPHSSPMEHCAKAMNDVDYETHVKGLVPSTVRTGSLKGLTSIPLAAKGWCRNFKGFIPYRHIVESKNN